MSVFFPDNDNRRSRLLELSSDAQDFLNQAKSSYQEFTKMNAEVNTKIAEVYQKAGIVPPSVSPVDILEAQKSSYDLTNANTIIDVSSILLDVGGFAATILYFAPAATSFLVDAGLLGAETASAVLFSALGTEVTIGALAGGIVAGIVAGIIVVGIGLAIDAFEGYELRDELRQAIYQVDQLRASTKFSLDKSKKALDALESVKTTCDSLLQESIELTDAIITNLIQKNAIPALQAIEQVTKESVLNELSLLDQSRNSWTNEDKAGQDLLLPAPAPIYLNAGVEVPINLVPSIPNGLKLTALQDPNNLNLKINYPILKVESVQYWPFSYVDNRDGMAIVAFDSKGNILQRWDKLGARYIWKIEEDVNSNFIAFVGQSEKKIIMRWSELTSIKFNPSVSVSGSLIPKVPEGLKLVALQNADTLDEASNYPVILIGNVQYWPLSYLDNRDGMAIIAFDSNGNVLQRWDKLGARYIWKIEKNLSTKEVTFIGQSQQEIVMQWSELTRLK